MGACAPAERAPGTAAPAATTSAGATPHTTAGTTQAGSDETPTSAASPTPAETTAPPPEPTGSPAPAPAEDPDAAERLATALTDGGTADATAAIVESLARAGIETRDGTDGALLQEVVDPSGLRVLRLQARGLALEAQGRGGFEGRRLNALTDPLPLPDGGTIPTSAMIAAYVTEGETFGARLSRALMGDVAIADHERLVYPSVTVLLYLRDIPLRMLGVAEARTARAAPWSAVWAPRMRLAGVDACQEISDFLDDLPGAVERAVEEALADDDGEFGIFDIVVAAAAAVAGAVVEAGVDIVRGALRHNPFVEAVRNGANILGGLVDLHAMFAQWEVTVEPTPAAIHRSVGGETTTAELTATIDAGEDELEWPEELESCAELFDIELPSTSPDGGSVAWTELAGFDELAVRSSADTEVASGMATFTLAGAPEEPDVHEAGGPEDEGSATVKADIALPGLERLAGRIAGAVGASGLVEGVVEGVAAEAAEMLGPSGTGSATVTSHAEVRAAMVDFSAPGFGGSVSFSAESCTGIYGTWRGTWTVSGPVANGTTPVEFEFSEEDRTATITESFSVGGLATSMTLDLTLTLEGDPDAATMRSSGTATATIPRAGPAVGDASGSAPVEFGPAGGCL